MLLCNDKYKIRQNKMINHKIMTKNRKLKGGKINEYQKVSFDIDNDNVGRDNIWVSEQ